MKSIVFSAALFVGTALAVPAFGNAQSMGQDMKDLGHDSKNAAKTGTADTKKGATKSTHAVKKGVHKGATKVDDKTRDTNPKQ